MTKSTEQAFKKLPILYVGDNFKEWFYPLAFNSKTKVKKLESQKLPREMNDGEIIRELNPGEVSIEEIVATLKTLDHSAWALFYCKDINGALRAVYASWGAVHGGWCVCARGASRSFRWGVGSRVFSRNLVNAKKLGTSAYSRGGKEGYEEGYQMAENLSNEAQIVNAVAEAIERTQEGCIKTIMGIPCVEAAQVFKNRAIKKIKENSSLRDNPIKEK